MFNKTSFYHLWLFGKNFSSNITYVSKWILVLNELVFACFLIRFWRIPLFLVYVFTLYSNVKMWIECFKICDFLVRLYSLCQPCHFYVSFWRNFSRRPEPRWSGRGYKMWKKILFVKNILNKIDKIINMLCFCTQTFI